MLGIYADSESSPTTKVVIHSFGDFLRASINIGISKENPQGRLITFSEVSYNVKSGVIEMFKDGAIRSTSYYFTGVIKDNSLQGQLANTSGRILELDLKLSSVPSGSEERGQRTVIPAEAGIPGSRLPSG